VAAAVAGPGAAVLATVDEFALFVCLCVCLLALCAFAWALWLVTGGRPMFVGAGAAERGIRGALNPPPENARAGLGARPPERPPPRPEASARVAASNATVMAKKIDVPVELDCLRIFMGMSTAFPRLNRRSKVWKGRVAIELNCEKRRRAAPLRLRALDS
jgi:hypothetical protein